MDPLKIVFLAIAALTLLSAGMVVTARRMMHAALWLVLTLLGVAAIFATLESGFFTAVQVVIYVGAIAILIIFAVMLTRRGQQEDAAPTRRSALLAALAAALLCVMLAFVIGAFPTAQALRPQAAVEDVAALGKALVSPDGYVIPFEVASVLLIGALIGAIYVAGDRQK